MRGRHDRTLGRKTAKRPRFVTFCSQENAADSVKLHAMKRITPALLTLFTLVMACHHESTSTTSTQTSTAAESPSANPFLTASTLQYETPPFDKIKDEHYKPALEEGMKQPTA